MYDSDGERIQGGTHDDDHDDASEIVRVMRIMRMRN